DRPLLELGELRSLSGLEEGDLDVLRGDASDHDVRPLGEGIRDAPRVDLLRKGFTTVLGRHGFPVLANLPVLVAAESLARLLNPLVPLLRRLDPVAFGGRLLGRALDFLLLRAEVADVRRAIRAALDADARRAHGDLVDDEAAAKRRAHIERERRLEGACDLVLRVRRLAVRRAFRVALAARRLGGRDEQLREADIARQEAEIDRTDFPTRAIARAPDLIDRETGERVETEKVEPAPDDDDRDEHLPTDPAKRIHASASGPALANGVDERRKAASSIRRDDSTDEDETQEAHEPEAHEPAEEAILRQALVRPTAIRDHEPAHREEDRRAERESADRASEHGVAIEIEPG